MAASTAQFAFAGAVKREHDVGEALGADLMTLGLAEFFLSPSIVSERSADASRRLKVWLTRDGDAVAYLWLRK